MKLLVFYFDDQEVLLDIFKEMFSDEYDVRTASTLAEAEKMLLDCSPDIIVSDLSMPEISGVEFLKRAVKVCPASVRIMVTGFAQVGDLVDQIGAGVIQFFAPKPWREEQMRDVLRRAAALTRRDRQQRAAGDK